MRAQKRRTVRTKTNGYLRSLKSERTEIAIFGWKVYRELGEENDVRLTGISSASLERQTEERERERSNN